jgi:hypothetical protein
MVRRRRNAAQLELWPEQPSLWPPDDLPPLGPANLPAASKKASKPDAPPPANPWRLHTTPGSDREPLNDDDVAGHREYLGDLYAANYASISTLENRIDGGAFRRGLGAYKGTLIRPPWAVGWTNDALYEQADRLDLNPYEDAWWERGHVVTCSGELRIVWQSGLRGTGKVQGTASQARAELARLEAEQALVGDAITAIDTAATGTAFYRELQVEVAPLPWDLDEHPAPLAQPVVTPEVEPVAPLCTDMLITRHRRGRVYLAPHGQHHPATQQRALRQQADSGRHSGDPGAGRCRGQPARNRQRLWRQPPPPLVHLARAGRPTRSGKRRRGCLDHPDAEVVVRSSRACTVDGVVYADTAYMLKPQLANPEPDSGLPGTDTDTTTTTTPDDVLKKRIGKYIATGGRVPALLENEVA